MVFITMTVAQLLSQCALSLQTTNAKCAYTCDGSIIAIPVGGIPPYTYLWNHGETTQSITALCASSDWWGYSVTVTDSLGCIATDTAIITEPQPIYLVQTSAFSCITNTGTASGIASGGIPPYTYMWSPSSQSTQIATGLNVGGYTVTVTDSNLCSVSSNVTVAAISAVPKVNHLNYCAGASLSFTDQSVGNPVQWNWSFGNGYTSSLKDPYYNYPNPGTFQVTLIVTNSLGCQDTNQLSMTINPNPIPNFSVQNIVEAGNPTCFTDLSTISSGSIASWSWNFGDLGSTTNTSNLENPCHVYISEGIYDISLIVISDSACLSELIWSSGVTVVGIENISKNKSIDIYPNPFSSQTILQTNNFLHNATLTIDNSLGQTVKQIKNISGQRVILFRDNLPNGLYFLRLTEDNKIFINKLVIVDN